MQSFFSRLSVRRALMGLAAIAVGAMLFALAGADSWAGLAALAIALAGAVVICGPIVRWRDQLGAARRQAAAVREPHGCVSALTRVAVIVVSFAALAWWIWAAGSDLNELRMLASSPHYGMAQVIGKELVAAGVSTGYVHYAYRVSATLAPEDRFPVAVGEYRRIRAGQNFEVTYSRADPRTHRIGHVSWQTVVRRLLFWLLLLGNGAVYLMLSLKLAPTIARRSTHA